MKTKQLVRKFDIGDIEDRWLYYIFCIPEEPPASFIGKMDSIHIIFWIELTCDSYVITYANEILTKLPRKYIEIDIHLHGSTLGLENWKEGEKKVSVLYDGRPEVILKRFHPDNPRTRLEYISYFKWAVWKMFRIRGV